MFYVSAAHGSDTNPGTESAPFLTLARAQDAMRKGGAAGAQVFVMLGVYYEEMVFTPADSGTAGAPAVIHNPFEPLLLRFVVLYTCSYQATCTSFYDELLMNTYLSYVCISLSLSPSIESGVVGLGPHKANSRFGWNSRALRLECSQPDRRVRGEWYLR